MAEPLTTGLTDEPETDNEKSAQIADQINLIDAADPTKFLTRSFAVIWNEGHSIRLVSTQGRGSISIPWDERKALINCLRGTRPVTEDKP